MPAPSFEIRRATAKCRSSLIVNLVRCRWLERNENVGVDQNFHRGSAVGVKNAVAPLDLFSQAKLEKLNEKCGVFPSVAKNIEEIENLIDIPLGLQLTLHRLSCDAWKEDCVAMRVLVSLTLPPKNRF